MKLEEALKLIKERQDRVLLYESEVFDDYKIYTTVTDLLSDGWDVRISDKEQIEKLKEENGRLKVKMALYEMGPKPITGTYYKKVEDQ